MNASGLVVRTWNDAPISRRDSDGYADATAMCQANGKRWHEYSSNQRTTEYIAALGESLNLPADQLVITTTSGPNHLRGTWVHPRLAVDLARWLSPQFAVFMDGWFLEQLKQAKPAPALHGDGWRTMDIDGWSAQPINLRAAQYLLTEAEAGGSRAIDLIRHRCNRYSDPALPVSSRHCIHSLYDLAPSARGVLLTVRRLRASGGPARGTEVRQELSAFWSPDTISNQLTKLRQEGLMSRRGTGWYLTTAAEELAQDHDRNQDSTAAA
jgi:hypothetical protein